MVEDTFFVDVILPLPVPNFFTYRVPLTLNKQLMIGQRVIVPFGKGGKLYTALIKKIHNQPPKEYESKYIDALLDDRPIVNDFQLKLWDWIAEYYMANPGDVFNAALPGALKLAGETKLVLYPDKKIDYSTLSDKEYLIVEALEVRNTLTLLEVSEVLSVKNVHTFIQSLIQKQVIVVYEEVKDKFKPKMVAYLKLTAFADNEENLKLLFDKVSSSKKQLSALMAFVQLSNRYQKNQQPVEKIVLQKTANVSAAIINKLVEKGIFEVYEQQKNRFDDYANALITDATLNKHQQQAFTAIKQKFETKDVVLLHGVTGSGKTEIYIKLIKEALEKGEQVLYLLPEIALTTQLIVRLQKVFGDTIGVYHSKFNENERVEVWNEVLNFNENLAQKTPQRFQIVMGARSSMFLPFSKLGLIIIDEEHENTFKQFDPAPRYHARDTSIVLANLHQAKVLLGSATPAIETYWNAQQGKYGLVTLTERHGGVLLPEILCADIKEATRKKLMKQHFSPLLIEAMEEAFKNKEQVILFQNRRGYAPFMICEDCGHVPQCNHCDVSLTYHKYTHLLKCHYCGASKKMPSTCPACGSARITLKGFGTEQIEEELAIYFPTIRVARMDADTTRTKNSYHKLIIEFEDRNIDVLVGTQMVTKGLDFNNVSLVGVLNADSMLNFPDFRSFERSFQLMSQVSGRAGRTKRGKVIIQTYEPYHPIIRQVIDTDFIGMYNDELVQRKKFAYPPFFRLIHFTLSHKDKNILNAGADEFSTALKQSFGNRLLGPDFPSISRIKNKYHKNCLLKVERNLSISKARTLILAAKNQFEAFSKYKSVRISIDVDVM